MTWKRIFTVLASTTIFLTPGSARALSNLTPTDLSALTSQDSVDTLIKTIGVGADFRAFMPASPLGNIGMDIGMDFAIIKLPADFKDILALIGAPVGSDYLPIPQIAVHKGLPYGLNLGFSYISYQGNSLIGADIQWTFLKGTATRPDVAIRASDSLLKLYFMSTRTYKLDVVASKKFSFLLEPYAGAGMEFTSGDLDVALGGSTGLPLALSGHSAKNAVHTFFGFPFKMLFLKLTAEYDYSFAGITTYGGKISLAI